MDVSSCSSTNFESDDLTLFALEKGSYLNLNSVNDNLSISNIKTRLLEFSQFLNSTGRLSLLKCNKSESEEFVSLLLLLKKTIKHCVSELGQSKINKGYSFICSECDDVIDVPPNQNVWESLQNHDHFEELYYRFLNGTLNVLNEGIESITLDDRLPLEEIDSSSSNENEANDYVNENPDPGETNENDTLISATLDQENCNGDVNSFRFNFSLHYDEIIETKIYPQTLIDSIRKIDKIREYTIQRAGPFRAVCLLCSCDLVTRSKVSKKCIMDHSLGQRHLRFATNPVNLSALKKYHEIWLNLEPGFQSHQVYFRPEMSSNFKCVLCGGFVSHKHLIAHIKSNPHKKRVLEMFEKKSNIFYLNDLQVQLYGVTKEEIEAKKEVKKNDAPIIANTTAKTVVTAKKRTDKTDSDSSPSSEPKELAHNIIMAVQNTNSNNILDKLPNRYKDHLNHLKNENNVITCKACNISLGKDIDAVKKHVRQPQHMEASKVVAKKYIYHCEICNVKVLDENFWEKHFLEGPNKHESMAESRKSKTTEYECTVCCVVIYGDDLSLTRHLSVNLKRGRQSKEPKLPDPVQRLLRSKEAIDNEAHLMTSEANDTLRYNQLTVECCAKLQTTLSVTFEGCEAHPFGSRISGLGNKFSDLDVFIDTGGMYTGYKNQDAVAQVQLVRKAASIFSKRKDEFRDVVQIPTARTPIIKLYHRDTEIECDLSFRHGLSVENTKFIRFCLDLQPITQPFILLLKKWSELNNFTEHITTYALAILAIFFLQSNNYLLSVKKLREMNPKQSLVINGWETINYTLPLEEMQAMVATYPNTVWKLLRDFFQYYAKFSYNFDVVCPLLGRTIKKSQFHNEDMTKSLPKEMKSYLVQLQTEDAEQFRAMSPFCIQDPFDLSHNLTKACQFGTVNRFKTMCDLSFKHIDALN